MRETSFPRLEFKSKWDSKYGRDISAIANDESQTGGWLVVGVDDDGKLAEHDEKWAKQFSEKIGNQVNEFLTPSSSVRHVTVEAIGTAYIILIEIANPGDVTEWQGEAYKLSASSSKRMTSEERVSLAMKLPGEDFTKEPWDGEIDSSLVLDFAKKVADARPDEFSDGLKNLSSVEILKRLQLYGTRASGILFGDYPVRIAYYNADDDVLENTTKEGIYNILTDNFLSQIQAWTKKEGTVVEGNTTSVTDTPSYPAKLLREIFANATAHALYQREQGEIIIDICPDRIVARNNASLEAKHFTQQWFSKKTFVKNKVLMTALRTAQITDELGTGKARIFRLAMESGKKPPIIEFTGLKNYGKWQITVYNNVQYKHLTQIMEKFYDIFPTKPHARIAVALVFWKKHQWNSILERLDEYHQEMAQEVLEHPYAPVTIIDNEIFVKRWIEVALTGQQSKSFTPLEEEKIRKILAALAFQNGRKGMLTTQEAKTIIGLGNSQSESTQLSNLFRKWRDENIVTNEGRGRWKFLSHTDALLHFVANSRGDPIDFEKILDFFKKNNDDKQNI